MSTMTEAIPSKLVKPSNNLPYLTSDLLKLIRMKHRLFKHACAAATDLAWSKYKTIRNHVTSALKTARCRFFNSLSSKLNSHSDFWKSFHKLSPKKTRIPVDLSLGNESSSISPSKANLLNRSFASCFFPRTSTKFTLHRSTDIPTPENIPVDESEIAQLLSQQKTNTATGPDGISGHMLHHTALAIANSLTKIFRLSLKQQKVPSPWKVSYVNPIPKGKDIQLCSNYRPISLLSLPSKILKRLIHSHIRVNPGQFNTKKVWPLPILMKLSELLSSMEKPLHSKFQLPQSNVFTTTGTLISTSIALFWTTCCYSNTHIFWCDCYRMLQIAFSWSIRNSLSFDI